MPSYTVWVGLVSVEDVQKEGIPLVDGELAQLNLYAAFALA